MRNLVLALLWLGLIPAQLVPAALARPPAQPQSTKLLERSWQKPDAQLRVLDQLLPSEPEPPVGDVLSTPELPANLIRANQPATGPIQPADMVASPPLNLPSAQQLQAGSVVSLSLEQALAIAFANSASLQASMGSYSPTISAFADGGYEGCRSTTTSNKPNANLGFGPLFAPNGLLTTGPNSTSIPSSGPSYRPNDGSVTAPSGESGLEGGLQLNDALLDFARTPTVRAAPVYDANLAKLSSARRSVTAAVEAFRDVRLRYLTGLDSELNLSKTQVRLINSLVRRINATVNVNITDAKWLKELLPTPRDPHQPIQPQRQLTQLQLSNGPAAQP